MKSAINSNGGVQGVHVIHCEPLEPKDTEQPFPKWDGISMINDVVYNEENIVVWRAYNIGKGNTISHKDLDFPDPTKLPKLRLVDDDDSKPVFIGVKPRRSVKEKCVTIETPAQESDDSECGEELFTCPEDGCTKSFQRYANLEHHLDYGRHIYSLEKETLFDKAKLKYAEYLESGDSCIESKPGATEPSEQIVLNSNLPMGWALKGSSTGRRRFTDNQKKYMRDIFILGEQTGRKADPDNVAPNVLVFRAERFEFKMAAGIRTQQ